MTFKDLHSQIQGLSRTMSIFKDFQGPCPFSRTFKDHVHFEGLSRPGKLGKKIQGLSRTFIHRFKDFQGPCPFSRTFKDHVHF